MRDLGGWDESYAIGPNDTELCWRAQLEGYSFGHATGAIMHYRLRATTAEVSGQAFAHGRRIPLLIRRFRRHGLPMRVIALKALRFAGFLVFMAPLAIFVTDVRTEWVRRASMAAGFLRGVVSRQPEPIRRAGLG